MVLFANNCQNVYEKQVIFKGFQNQKFQGVKMKRLVMLALSARTSQKSNFKVDESARFLEETGGRIGLTVEKW